MEGERIREGDSRSMLTTFAVFGKVKGSEESTAAVGSLSLTGLSEPYLQYLIMTVL
jgi:hypothetical protein